MIAAAPLCPCGSKTAHRIARRDTADGIRIDLWSDGTVTSGMGFQIPGVGVSRSNFEIARDVEAGWLAFGEVELYDAAEISRLIAAARRAIRQRCDAPRAAMLRYFSGYHLRPLKGGTTFEWRKS